MEEKNLSRNELAAIGQRFHRFFRSRGFTGNEVSELMGKSPGTISNLVNGERFSSDVLVQIATSFPSINLEWLLLGTGEMEHHQERLSGDFATQIKVVQTEIQQLQKLATATTNKQAKERVRALSKTLEKALDMRFRLLGEYLDMYIEIIANPEPGHEH